MAPTLLGGCVYSGLWLGRWERKWVSTGSDMAGAGGQGFCPLMFPRAYLRLEMALARDTQAWVGGAACPQREWGLERRGARLQDIGGCRLLSLTQATGSQRCRMSGCTVLGTGWGDGCARCPSDPCLLPACCSGFLWTALIQGVIFLPAPWCQPHVSAP